MNEPLAAEVAGFMLSEQGRKMIGDILAFLDSYPNDPMVKKLAEEGREKWELLLFVHDNGGSRETPERTRPVLDITTREVVERDGQDHLPVDRHEEDGRLPPARPEGGPACDEAMRSEVPGE